MAAKSKSPASKPRGMAAWKQKMEAEMERLRQENEALKNQAPVAETAVSVAPAGAQLPVELDLAEGGYDPSVDPLAWIDDSFDEVHLIGRFYGMSVRRKINDQRGSQDKLYLNAIREAEWNACPFQFTDPDPVKQKEKEYLNREWWWFRVTRTLADEAYSGIEGRPEKVVVSPDDYKGLDPQLGVIRGRRTPSSTDNLRELVRYILQMNPKICWLYDDAGQYIEAGFITKNKPNPYGKGVEVEKGPSSFRPAYNR